VADESHRMTNSTLTEGQRPTRPAWLRWLVRAIPLAIFAVILVRVDIGQVLATFRSARLEWLIAGLAYRPMAIFMGGLRWQVLARALARTRLTTAFALRHTFIGLTSGAVLPGSLGWDFYRVALAGSRGGHFARNALVIVVEKLLGLIVSALLIVLLFPLVAGDISSPVLSQIFQWSAIVLAAAVVVATLALGLRPAWLETLLAAAEHRADLLGNDVAQRVGARPDLESAVGIERETDASLPGPLIGAFLLTIIPQLLTAASHYAFFASSAAASPVGFEICLSVPPIAILVLVLPVSFGGLGVREATLILVYGLFGVPAEQALYVAFCSLLSLLLCYAIGGGFILGSAPGMSTDR